MCTEQTSPVLSPNNWISSRSFARPFGRAHPCGIILMFERYDLKRLYYIWCVKWLHKIISLPVFRQREQASKNSKNKLWKGNSWGEWTWKLDTAAFTSFYDWTQDTRTGASLGDINGPQGNSWHCCVKQTFWGSTVLFILSTTWSLQVAHQYLFRVQTEAEASLHWWLPATYSLLWAFSWIIMAYHLDSGILFKQKLYVENVEGVRVSELDPSLKYEIQKYPHLNSVSLSKTIHLDGTQYDFVCWAVQWPPWVP